MRTPSPSYCGLDLVPPLADRFIWGRPLDYGPVLLRIPFGSRIAADTLSSEALTRRWLQVRLGCVRLSPSCPSRHLHTFLLSSAGEALPPPLDTAPLIRAPEGLSPSRSVRCPAHTTRWSAPGRSIGISALRFCRLSVFPLHLRTGSQVPYESLNKVHASCTPDAAWSVNRFPPCLSQRTFTTLVLTSSDPFSMRNQRFTCVRLPYSYMTQSSCAF